GKARKGCFGQQSGRDFGRAETPRERCTTAFTSGVIWGEAKLVKAASGSNPVEISVGPKHRASAVRQPSHQV
ncbi:MAG: hypothetical protein EAS49_15195, partial [Brucella intermedia]